MFKLKAYNYTKFYKHPIGLVGLLILFLASCQAKKSEIPLSSTIIWQSPNSSININKRVEWKAHYLKDTLTATDINDFLASPNQPINPNKILLLGSSKKFRNGWLKLQIINKNATPQEIIVDEDNHFRCDALSAYTYNNGGLSYWGKVMRITPISERRIPFFTYAISIRIPAKDTTDVIIKTERFYGIHELNLSISPYEAFIKKTTNQLFKDIIEVLVSFVCVIIMITLGWLFRDKSMLLLGFYISTIAIQLLFSNFPGLLDRFFFEWHWPSERSTIGTATAFLMNVFYHPFGMEIMKRVPKNELLFKSVSYAIMIINGTCFLLFFLPDFLFQKISYGLPMAFVVGSVISIIWLFYSAIIAYARAKIKYFIFAASFGLLHFLFDQILGLFSASEKMESFILSNSSFTLSLMSIYIIIVYQLGNRLLSRKNHENSLEFVKQKMEEVRLREIQTIGRNLHDNFGNSLASAIGYLNLKKQPIQKVQSILHESIKEIRFISHNLVKNENLPISLKLSRLTERFNEFSSINFRFFDFTQKQIDSYLSEVRQLNLYYIIQELYTNIIKYSFASEVSLQIFQEHEKIWLIIEDDGIEWNTKPFTSDGIGLVNVFQRAELSNFIITLDNNPKGTNVIIKINHENDLPNH